MRNAKHYDFNWIQVVSCSFSYSYGTWDHFFFVWNSKLKKKDKKDNGWI